MNAHNAHLEDSIVGMPHRRTKRNVRVQIVRGFDDLLMVYAIRAAVYMAEQDCPYAEEFDGNDLCATHFIALVDGEPAGCVRARFFHDFAKIERLAVRKAFRKSRVAFDLVRDCAAHVRRKGFSRIYGHARRGIEDFWSRFGAKPIPGSSEFVFSGYAYTEMLAEYPPLPDTIDLNDGPLVILRPEGEWDRPGILERSSQRATRESAGEPC